MSLHRSPTKLRPISKPHSQSGREDEKETPTSRQVLSLFDCVCIIVGTIIGAGIFKFPAVVAGNLPSVSIVILAWVLGGVIALIGALCFAELTTTYPDHGGDYGYLKRGYHRRVGFAFSWAAFWIIRPGNIGTMAMIFGEFAAQILPSPSAIGLDANVFYAVASVILISALNLLGIRFGKATQNALTLAKVVGILLIVISAIYLSGNAATKSNITTVATTAQPSLLASWNSFWLAMVFVMFTYGGWNDIAFVAREVQEPRKNLLRSLVIGTLCVLAICLLVNFGLIYSLGFERMQSIGAEWGNPTLYLVQQGMGEMGERLFAVLVCVSCLGAINAMIFTSPRIYWATAKDYPGLRWLAGSQSEGGWWRALVLQMVVTATFILLFSSDQGIENITAATAPYFWLFLALTVISLMINRTRYRGQFEGYRVPLYPMTPLLFVSACAFMAYQAWTFMIGQGLLNSTIMIGAWVLLGIGMSFVMRAEMQTQNTSE